MAAAEGKGGVFKSTKLREKQFRERVLELTKGLFLAQDLSVLFHTGPKLSKKGCFIQAEDSLQPNVIGKLTAVLQDTTLSTSCYFAEKMRLFLLPLRTYIVKKSSSKCGTHNLLKCFLYNILV